MRSSQLLDISKELYILEIIKNCKWNSNYEIHFSAFKCSFYFMLQGRLTNLKRTVETEMQQKILATILNICNRILWLSNNANLSNNRKLMTFASILCIMNDLC